ncbi:MAG: lysophospholipid acyltransferase family protein [Betaproteobacteria bacterium]|nr:lysophospholipid acyltransferase family protein [Betaproteobacteria bacterium]
MHRLLRFLLGAAALLPLPILHAVGSVLGWTIYALSPAYRRSLEANLRQAGIADAGVRREAIASAGKLLAEVPALWFRRHEAVERLVRRVEGAEPAYAARDRGEPILFLTPHMGAFEITAQYAARHTPITVLYRPPKIAALDPLMREGRGRARLRLVPADVTGVRELFAALRRREAVGFLPDQVPSEGEGEWADFFGRPAYTMTLAAKLAERRGIACFLAYARRLPMGRGFEIVLKKYPDKQPGETSVRRLNRAIEDLVRECPGQYLWSYNRYKVPKGQAAKTPVP